MPASPGRGARSRRARCRLGPCSLPLPMGSAIAISGSSHQRYGVSAATKVRAAATWVRTSSSAGSAPTSSSAERSLTAGARATARTSMSRSYVGRQAGGHAEQRGDRVAVRRRRRDDHDQGVDPPGVCQVRDQAAGLVGRERGEVLRAHHRRAVAAGAQHVGRGLRPLEVGVAERWRVVVHRLGRLDRRPCRRQLRRVHPVPPAERSPPRAGGYVRPAVARHVSWGRARGSSLVSAPSTRKSADGLEALPELRPAPGARGRRPLPGARHGLPARRDPQRPLPAAVRRDHAGEPAAQARPGPLGHPPRGCHRPAAGGHGLRRSAVPGRVHRRPGAGLAAQPGPRPRRGGRRAAAAAPAQRRARHRRAARGSCCTTPRPTASWPSRSARPSCASSTCRRYLGRWPSTDRCACSRSSPRPSTSRSSTSRPSGGGSARPWPRASRRAWWSSTGCRAPRSASSGPGCASTRPTSSTSSGTATSTTGCARASSTSRTSHGKSSPVTSSVLGPFVRDHDPLRMVVLNACRSARTDAVDPFARDGAGPGAAGRHGRGRDAVPDQRPCGCDVHRRVLRRPRRRASRRPGGQQRPQGAAGRVPRRVGDARAVPALARRQHLRERARRPGARAAAARAVADVRPKPPGPSFWKSLVLFVNRNRKLVLGAAARTWSSWSSPFWSCRGSA